MKKGCPNFGQPLQSKKREKYPSDGGVSDARRDREILKTAHFCLQ